MGSLGYSSFLYFSVPERRGGAKYQSTDCRNQLQHGRAAKSSNKGEGIASKHPQSGPWVDWERISHRQKYKHQLIPRE